MYPLYLTHCISYRYDFNNKYKIVNVKIRNNQNK